MAYTTSIDLDHQGYFHVYPTFHGDNGQIPTSVTYWHHKRKWRYPSIKRLVKAVELCNAWCDETNIRYRMAKNVLDALDKPR